MKHHFFTTILFLLSIAMVGGSQVENATESLKNKQYQSAINQYQSVLDEGQTSAEIHYNMGVAYAELKQIGQAIWHFRLAERGGLDSDDLEDNLRLVQEERKDEIEIVPEFFLAKWWNTWKNMLGSNVWSILALLFIMGGTYGLYIWRMSEDRNRRKFGFTIGIPLIMVGLLCFLSAWSASNDRLHPSQGVLLSNTFDLRSAPDYDSAELLTIHEGVDIEVRDQIGDWVKVRLANGQIGWLPIQEVGLF